MFNNLVESASDVRRSAKQSAFFGVTAVINIVLLTAVFVWSLYSFDITAFGQNDDLAINTLVAPVPIPDKEPITEPEVKPTQKSASEDLPKGFDYLKNPVENINRPTEPPKEVSVVKSDGDPIRDNVPYIKTPDGTRRSVGTGEDVPTRQSDGSNTPAIAVKTQKDDEEKEIVAPPASKPAPEVKKPVNVSKGVVNGLAVSLPKPSYPAPARMARISGTVNVQVTIDENGRVIAANAVDGHPLLRAAAVQAARQAKFTPTKLSEQSVKVTGVIVYNFVPQ